MDREKLGELILYIAEKSKTDPSFGLTKLNKILFAIDFYFYGHMGRPVTKSKYIHQDNGPVPEDMPKILRLLNNSKRIDLIPSTYFGYSQKRVVPLSGPDLTMFSDDELTFADEVIERFRSFNATELSNWTHTLRPWLLTNQNEEIPYACIFVIQNLPIEKAGIDWAKEELNRLGKIA